MNPYDAERLVALQPFYEANDNVRRQLGEKVLTRVLGPFAVGKSTVIRKVIELESRQAVASWGEPGSLTTRHRRPDDSESYQTANEGIRIEGLIKRIAEGSLTNYSLHPSGVLYATGPESFAYDYNLMPTLPSSVAPLDRAGFSKTYTAFITAEPGDLKAGMATRRHDASFEARVREGIANTEYALDHRYEMRFIRNSRLEGGLEMAAEDLASLSIGVEDFGDASEIRIVNAMRKCLQEQISHE